MSSALPTRAPRHRSSMRHSLLQRVALTFAVAVILTALALALSAYFISKAESDQDALDKALSQSRFNLALAEAMLPASPQDSDYKKLVNAFQIRGDFATLIETGQQPYHSGFDVSADLITPQLAAKVAESHLGYQMISLSGRPALVVGGPARSGQLAIYFFYPQDARLAQLAQFRNILIIAGVVLAVLGALAGYVLARGLVRPIRRTTKAAVRMSEGDLDIRLPVGSDEFGVLATSFNRMAESLQAKMLDLEAGQARERRFVADVTHELRTPVSALVGEASLLKSKLESGPPVASPELTRLVTMVNTDITRLRQLVDDLLEISRLDAQAAETVIEPVAVNSFLEQLLRAHNWSDAVNLSTPPPPVGTPAEPFAGDPIVLADRRRMERILVNLIENAFLHGGTPISLESSTGADEQGRLLAHVAVTDHGAGISPQHLPYVFDRFYKADPSRASSRGSGLGLAIARENARLLGGELAVANVPGGGARFLLTLPVATD